MVGVHFPTAAMFVVALNRSTVVVFAAFSIFLTLVFTLFFIHSLSICCATDLWEPHPLCSPAITLVGGGLGISKEPTGAHPPLMAFRTSPLNCISVLQVMRSACSAIELSVAQ